MIGLALCPLLGFAQQLDTGTLALPRKASLKSAHPMERYIPPGFGVATPTVVKPTTPFPSASAGSPDTSNGNANPDIPSNPVAYNGSQPLTATVTHTLYLPPAMYGQWNVSGTLMETNAPDLFSATVNDIWLLERTGDQVTVTNPVNGAYATINVDKAEGNQAMFHRTGTVGPHSIFQEIPTITVHGDTFNGQSVNKIQEIRNGQVVAEVYGLYHLEATRLSAASVRFHPETEQRGPDLQIEEVRH